MMIYLPPYSNTRLPLVREKSGKFKVRKKSGDFRIESQGNSRKVREI